MKNVLISWSNFALKKVSYAASRKVFFNLVKKFFKWIEDYSRSLWILVGSETDKKLWSGSLRKRVLMSLSNFAPIKVSVCSSTKSVFRSNPEVVQMKWGIEYDCMHPSRFWTKSIFWSGLSTNILRSKNCRYAVSPKVFFKIVKKLFKWSEG